MEEKEEKNIEVEDDKEYQFKKEMHIIAIISLFLIIIVLLYLILLGSINQPIEMATKPIIYLYPEQETEVTLELKDISILTHTYPTYSSEGWNVLAKPNGDLIDLNTGRNLYSLYWEGKNDTKLDMSVGFVIEGRDTISFLEEKLALLGLSQREANEFIIYWLPQMENNKYNFIYFVQTEEMNEYMPLEVTPAPDTSIRILMKFKALDKYIEVKEQEIKTPERKGFVLVEWGGTKYE